MGPSRIATTTEGIPPEISALRRIFLVQAELGGRAASRWASLIFVLARHTLQRARRFGNYPARFLADQLGLRWAVRVERSFEFLLDESNELDSEASGSD